MRIVQIGQDHSGGDFRGRDLRDSYFRDCTFDGADCAGADLRGVTLYRCSCRGVNLTDAKLDGMVDKETDWMGATFPQDAPENRPALVWAMLRSYAATLTGKKKQIVLMLADYMESLPYDPRQCVAPAVRRFKEADISLQTAKQMAIECFGDYPRILKLIQHEFKRQEDGG